MEETNELRCKICGKLASDDCHFYKEKMLCNRHYLQMYRHGKIISEKEINHKYEKVCDICGDTESSRYTMWSGDDEHNGEVLCNKHHKQMRNYGEIIDEYASSHIAMDDRKCDICGSNHHVIYHKGKYYCLRHYSQIKNLGCLKEITVFDKNEYYIEDGVGYIVIRNQKNENVAKVKVDVEDIGRLVQYKWRLGTWGYAESKVGLMQRFVLGEYESHKIIDHINRDTLDNRKANLRAVDKSLNAVNADIRSNNTSGVTGVSWNDRSKSWRAYINYQGDRIWLGYYKNFKDAVVARLNAENKYYAGMQPQKELFDKYGVKIHDE